MSEKLRYRIVTNPRTGVTKVFLCCSGPGCTELILPDTDPNLWAKRFCCVTCQTNSRDKKFKAATGFNYRTQRYRALCYRRRQRARKTKSS